jgi:hypothetical protein
MSLLYLLMMHKMMYFKDCTQCHVLFIGLTVGSPPCLLIKGLQMTQKRRLCDAYVRV